MLKRRLLVCVFNLKKAGIFLHVLDMLAFSKELYIINSSLHVFKTYVSLFLVTDPTTSPAHTESPTSEKVPVTTQRQTTWRYRKWKTCYPAKSGPKCGPKSGQQKRRRVCVFVDTNERTKPANCEGEQILLRPCVHKKCASEGLINSVIVMTTL